MLSKYYYYQIELDDHFFPIKSQREFGLLNRFLELCFLQAEAEIRLKNRLTEIVLLKKL